MTSVYQVQPPPTPVRGCIRPPGSKSLTNRALVVAALADGESRLTGALDCRDTQVMVESLRKLGVPVRHEAATGIIELRGCGGTPPATQADLWLENSGTSLRFLTAVCCLGHGRFRLDGNQRMRQRPIADLVEALRILGVDIRCEQNNGCPPVVVDADGLRGGRTRISGRVSSQYLSGLLMAAPGARQTTEIRVVDGLVSMPYVDMTLGVMRAFGVEVERPEANSFRIPPQSYHAGAYDIEPDATAASYFFAAAAITGGEVTVTGLTAESLQGDVGFVDVLEQMGCTVTKTSEAITVRGGPLKGIDVDMNAISDTAQTLAVVAMFADGPTRIRNIAHTRHKETDRIKALVTELGRLGLVVEEHADGLTIHPGPVKPTTVATYDDHRMAMSFAVAGLRVPGLRIADPGCTAKTYPHFFEDLEALCRSGA